MGFARGEAEAPAIIVDHDGDMIGIVEGRGGALERGVVEIPLRRGELPDQLGEVAPVFLVARPAAFGGEVILIPPGSSALGGKGSGWPPGCRSDSR